MNWQERAEKAEAELKAAREQKPALVMCGGYEWRTVAEAEHFCRINHASHPVRVFYASPIPAPAVPERWRNDVFAAADELRLTLSALRNGFVKCENCGEQETTSDLDCVSDIDGALELLDELLQSAEVTK